MCVHVFNLITISFYAARISVKLEFYFMDTNHENTEIRSLKKKKRGGREHIFLKCKVTFQMFEAVAQH